MYILSYVQTNIPKVSYFIIKIGLLIYSKRIIIIQRRQPQKSPFNKCIEITSGKKKTCFVSFLVNNKADFNKLQVAFG